MSCFLSYVTEKKYKSEFIMSKSNEKLNKDLRHILENLPEGILILEKDTKKVVLANSELKRIFNCQLEVNDSRLEDMLK